MTPHLPTVIARTPRWLVVAKPAGWLTVPPSRPGSTPSSVLSEWVRAELEPAGARAWTVHRIDRETSGLVLFALSEADHREASGWFMEHRVRKDYDCLVAGRIDAPVLRIRDAIDGAPSVSQVETRERWQTVTLARVRPMSGRRHQIRIHLAGHGHPILGDTRYGGAREVRITGRPGDGPDRLPGGVLAVARVALHAARLELPTKEAFEAAWPADFASWVARLRGQVAA